MMSHAAYCSYLSAGKAGRNTSRVKFSCETVGTRHASVRCPLASMMSASVTKCRAERILAIQLTESPVQIVVLDGYPVACPPNALCGKIVHSSGRAAPWPAWP